MKLHVVSGSPLAITDDERRHVLKALALKFIQDMDRLGSSAARERLDRMSDYAQCLEDRELWLARDKWIDSAQ